jgi:hypothetical protein
MADRDKIWCKICKFVGYCKCLEKQIQLNPFEQIL